MAESIKTEKYYHFSEKASEIVRTVGFAGLGAIWIFHREVDGTQLIPKTLAVAATFIISSLFFDLLQYVLSTG